jgi:hypothetical protein
LDKTPDFLLIAQHMFIRTLQFKGLWLGIVALMLVASAQAPLQFGVMPGVRV